MSDADLEAKFRKFAKGILSEGQTDALVKLCWSIEKLKDAGELARAAVPVDKA
jgi:hypothetical protein